MSIVLVIVGIVGILAALLLPIFCGWIGGGIAIVLGLVALLLGLSLRKKKGKGMGGIVMGALAIVLAVAISVSIMSRLQKLINLAKENWDIAPLTSEYVKSASLGLMGVVINVPKEEEDSLNRIVKEMEELMTLPSVSPDSAE